MFDQLVRQTNFDSFRNFHSPLAIITNQWKKNSQSITNQWNILTIH